MAVKDTQYRYFPSQERLVNVSNYMINPQHGSNSSSVGWMDKPTYRQHGGYDVSDSFRQARDRTLAGIVEASVDFEMRNVRWSEETATVSDLLSLRFPVIVKVVKGHRGHDGLQLLAGEILQVYTSFEELRVTATDSRDRTLTLPINCPLSVRLQSGSHCSETERTQMLSDLLKSTSLPARIEVVAVKKMDDPSTNKWPSSLSDSRLTLREISRQKFLVANAIKKGWLDQSRFVVIPEQLKLTFRLATGVRHVTEDEWKDIRGMYFRAARHLKFHLIDGYDGVIYDDWIDQSKPPIVVGRHSLGIDSDGEAEEEESDSEDSTTLRSRSRLLRQQAPLSQGSLPSLPTALRRNSTTGSDPGGPTCSPLGSVTPSHFSTESIQPSKSTESLLPRGSSEFVTVGKETVSKRKSNMPPRLLRRKAEPRRPDHGTATVLAKEFELKSDVTKTSFVPQKKSKSVTGSSSTSRSPNAAAVTGIVAMSRSSENGDACDIDGPRDLVFDEPMSRERTIRIVSETPVAPLSQRSLGNPENVSSKDVTVASQDDVENKRRKNDRIFHGSSDDTLLDFQSVDSHVWSPVYWSSDLCVGASVSGAESQITPMKQTKAQKRSAILSRDLCTYPNATTERPLSLDGCSTPLHIVPSRGNSNGFLDSTQSLFSSTSTELSSKHLIPSGTDRVHHGHRCLSSDDYGTSRAGTSNANCTPSGSSGCIASCAEHSTPIKLGVSRSRKLSNGLIRMKLDQNGTVLSSGSEAIDDGYSTKGNSMASSVETLQARLSVNAGRESLC